MSETTAGTDRLEGAPSLRWCLARVGVGGQVGDSRPIAADDTETVRRWKALRTDVMEPLILNHGGRVAEIAGDAVLVEFASAVNAVQWATQVQRVQHALQDKSDPFALHLRVGINVDDLIDDDGILQGDGVNIAARIHQAGAPGQIVITSRVREFVTNRLPLKFRDLGTPAMKNIVQPVRVFEIEGQDSGSARLMPQPHLHWTSRPTLAVLPFRSGTGGDSDTYFGEGITDAIITGLSCSRSMYVIARNSTLRYSKRTGETDLRQIAAELDVRFLLDGSVWRQQDRLRIKVDLIDVNENLSLWSQRFEGGGADVFEFQDRIAASVIGSLEPRLRAVVAARGAERATESLGALGLLLGTLGLAAVPGIPARPVQGAADRRGWLLLLAVWAGFAVVDVMLKRLAMSGTPATAALMVAFVLAFFGMLGWQAWRRLRHGVRPGLRHVAAGLLLGLLNFGNIVFYVRAHQRLPDSPAVVFATMNIGVVVLGTAVGVLAFGERTSRLNRVAIVAAIAAIALIALAPR